MILSCMWTLSNFIDHASSPWPPLLPRLSFTIPKQQYKTHTQKKKTAGTSHKKFSEWKQAHVGMELNESWNHNTFTLSLHLVPFKLSTVYTTKLSAYPLSLFICTKWTRCSALQLLTQQSSINPYPPCSAVIRILHTRKLLHALSPFIHTKWTRYSALLTPYPSIDRYLAC